MSFTCENKTKCFWSKQTFCLMMWLSVVLSPPFGKVGLAAENESLQHYKMLSAVEYTGKGQFRSQAETLFTVRKQPLSDDKVRYFLSANNFDLVGDSLHPEQQSSFKDLSFVIDRKTRHLSGDGENLALKPVANAFGVSEEKFTALSPEQAIRKMHTEAVLYSTRYIVTQQHFSHF